MSSPPGTNPHAAPAAPAVPAVPKQGDAKRAVDDDDPVLAAATTAGWALSNTLRGAGPEVGVLGATRGLDGQVLGPILGAREAWEGDGGGRGLEVPRLRWCAGLHAQSPQQSRGQVLGSDAQHAPKAQNRSGRARQAGPLHCKHIIFLWIIGKEKGPLQFSCPPACRWGSSWGWRAPRSAWWSWCGGRRSIWPRRWAGGTSKYKHFLPGTFTIH